MKLSAGARVVFATALPHAASARVVTVADSSLSLPGIDVATAKISEWSEFPAKGRATGGVRAHAFLKGEDALILAWVGPEPAQAVAADGSTRTLPASGAKRDASGTPLDAAVGSIGRML